MNHADPFEPVTTNLPPAGHGQFASMGLLTYGDGDGYRDHARDMLGFDPDYGHLLAYMTKRFGFPNRPGDPVKDLVGAWTLTTPRQDTLLRVSPFPGGHSHLSFEAILPLGAQAGFNRWIGGPRREREQRVLDRIESEGLPGWMARASELLSGGRNGWRDDFGILQVWARPAGTSPDTREAAELAELARLRAALFDRHAADLPEAPLRERSGPWWEWSADDPKRPYMEALAATLGDLLRPVFVNDVAIGLRGIVPQADLRRREAAGSERSSVMPVGRIVHGDQEAFGSLLRNAHALGGGGDVASGVREINAMVARAAAPDEGVPGPAPR